MVSSIFSVVLLISIPFVFFPELYCILPLLWMSWEHRSLNWEYLSSWYQNNYFFQCYHQELEPLFVQVVVQWYCRKWKNSRMFGEFWTVFVKLSDNVFVCLEVKHHTKELGLTRPLNKEIMWGGKSQDEKWFVPISRQNECNKT